MHVVDDELEARLSSARNSGWVVCRTLVRGQEDDEAAVGLVLTYAGLRDEDTDWREIPCDVAIETITKALTHGLAYREQLMPEPDALELADAVFQPFGNNARCRDNRAIGPWGISWTPVTDHDFDVAVVVLDDNMARVFCVSDDA